MNRRPFDPVTRAVAVAALLASGGCATMSGARGSPDGDREEAVEDREEDDTSVDSFLRSFDARAPDTEQLAAGKTDALDAGLDRLRSARLSSCMGRSSETERDQCEDRFEASRRGWIAKNARAAMARSPFGAYAIARLAARNELGVYTDYREIGADILAVLRETAQAKAPFAQTMFAEKKSYELREEGICLFATTPFGKPDRENKGLAYWVGGEGKLHIRCFAPLNRRKIPLKARVGVSLTVDGLQIFHFASAYKWADVDPKTRQVDVTVNLAKLPFLINVANLKASIAYEVSVMRIEAGKVEPVDEVTPITQGSEMMWERSPQRQPAQKPTRSKQSERSSGRPRA